MGTADAVSGLRERWYAETLRKKLARPFVHILFGARQTGKSTLLKTLLPSDSLRINLAIPEERSLHLARPDAFRRMCLALPTARSPRIVFVDEAQNAPHLFDAVQSLYDADKKRWQFVMCGSSCGSIPSVHSAAGCFAGARTRCGWMTISLPCRGFARDSRYGGMDPHWTVGTPCYSGVPGGAISRAQHRP